MYREIGAAPKYLPSDIIAGILSYANINHFTGNPEQIHKTIYNLRKQFAILKVFPFSKYDVYPFSRELEKVLFSLQRARIIGMENPDFERFVIKENGKKYIKEKILKRFTKDEKVMLRGIGKQFARKCSGI
ncbi:MAG: hypothetical protein AB1488_06105 [Nitrospirota bacterium]